MARQRSGIRKELAREIGVFAKDAVGRADEFPHLIATRRRDEWTVHHRRPGLDQAE